MLLQSFPVNLVHHRSRTGSLSLEKGEQVGYPRIIHDLFPASPLTAAKVMTFSEIGLRCGKGESTMIASKVAMLPCSQDG